MAIGSEPEIGVDFRVGVPVHSPSERWGPDLLGDYGSLHYPPRYPQGLRQPCQLVEALTDRHQQQGVFLT